MQKHAIAINGLISSMKSAAASKSLILALNVSLVHHIVYQDREFS